MAKWALLDPSNSRRDSQRRSRVVIPNRDRVEIVRYRWSKSIDGIESARYELERKKFSFAMNRIYFAVSVALLERVASFKKHTGVRSAFHREFIQSGLLSIHW